MSMETLQKRCFQLADDYRGRKLACKSQPVLGGAGGDQEKGLSPDKEPTARHDEVTICLKRKSCQMNPRFREETADYFVKRKVIGYKTLNPINRGGAVYKAVHKTTGEVVAVKEHNDGLMREIDILTSLPPHPRIVHFKEVAADDADGLYVVMEYMEYDLKRYIAVMDLSLNEIKMLMKQLLEGVKFLHANMVMHRDMKPSNILVNGSGVVKICDLGSSRRWKAEAGSYSPHVGTLAYRAPELLRGETAYSSAVDMWSVGCIMAEMLTKQVLFNGRPSRSGQLHKIHRVLGPPEKPLENILLRAKLSCGGGGGASLLSEAGFDFLSKLLTYDPTERITAESALNHVWFHEST